VEAGMHAALLSNALYEGSRLMLLFSIPLLAITVLAGVALSFLFRLLHFQDEAVSAAIRILAVGGSTVLLLPIIGQRLIQFTKLVLGG